MVVYPIFTNKLGKLYNADCLKVLSILKNDSIDLIFADPPFNLGKKYSSLINDKKTNDEYLSWTYEWLSLCIKKLKNGGSLFIYNIPKWNIYIANFLINKKIRFNNWIAIDFKVSMPIRNRLYPAHYSLLYFSKGKPNTFNRPKIPIQLCRHCKKPIKDYGGYKKIINANGGLNLSDVWYDITPVRHINKKNHNANELPEILLERIFQISTKTNDLIMDPFGGSGTSYVVAQKMQRKWIGIEIGNCEPIINRINKVI